MNPDVRIIGTGEAMTSAADAAVVIDVLRAFTVTPMLYVRGARTVWLATDDANALATTQRLRATRPAVVALKDGPPAPGFRLVNSPGRVAQLDLTDHDVVQTTANGTRGVLALADVPFVLAGSLVNASATAEMVREAGPRRVHLVVTGASGTADEDVACAELIRARLLGQPVDQRALIERVRASQAACDLATGVDAAFPGVHADDVRLACQVDSTDIALVRQHQRDLVHMRPFLVPRAGRTRGRRVAATWKTFG
ncbi:2-phosphosulfolactate phosphatase [Nocardioides sp. zg-1230]|uniref:2-phosphosulfolactate phosphatase n=1 Tax=Nocardioides sp. zg-1230 TaxID=2736601 RepID=UPI00155726BD|nr:2-phosphosulfolactate phosphatase [Nocardioides sp. zg-1230]NPC44144.1 2-phosphosulfolactate phosphatase [Nocardioides sp. zg-1230]